MKKFYMVAALAMTFVLASAVSVFANTTRPSTNDPSSNPVPHAGTADSSYLYTSPTTQQTVESVVGGAPSNDSDIVIDNGDGSTTTITRIHSNYTKNTNACAACHATHTAVGEDLLQWDDATATCLACHDGTAGIATYDVQSGHIGATDAITNGGLFPVDDGTNTSVSMHNVNSGLKLKDAPGGDYDANSGSWTEDFTCASCHTPHANGNFRLLDNNVNGFGDKHQITSWTAMTDVSSKPGFAAPAAGSKKFALQVSFQDVYSGNKFYANFVTSPYPYKVYLASNSSGAALTGYSVKYENGATVVTVPDSVATVYVKGFVGATVKGNIDSYLTADEKVTYINGFNDFCGACHTDYNTSMYFNDSKTGATTLTTNADGTVANPGALKTYTDLEGNKIIVPRHAVSALTGVYTQAYRHTVGFDAGPDGHGGLPAGLQFEQRTYLDSKGQPYTTNFMSCMTCHVAHGVDDAWWQAYGQKTDKNGNVYADFGALPQPEAAPAEVYSSDNPNTIGNAVDPLTGDPVYNTRGSNLKRLPNMGACEACHNKADGARGFSDSNTAGY